MKLYHIVFSPTGGTKKVTELLAGGLQGDNVVIDLTDSRQDFRSFVLTPEDVAVISVPSYGGRVPAVAVQRLTMLTGQGARAILVCVYGNRAYEDTLVELEDAAKQAGFRVIAAVAAVAEHSIARQFATGRPDAQDEKVLAGFAGRFRPTTLRRKTGNLRCQATEPTKKPAGQVWFPNPQRIAPSAVCASRRARCRQLTGTIPRR